MSVEFYRVLHFTALFFVFASLGILLMQGQNKKLWQLISGLAGFVAVVAGFGLLARRGEGFPMWAAAKLFLLLAMTGVSHVAAKRMQQKGLLVFWAVMLMGAGAVCLAVLKPF